MNIIWSPEAIEDLIWLRAYIAEESPAGARRIVLPYRVQGEAIQILPVYHSARRWPDSL